MHLGMYKIVLENIFRNSKLTFGKCFLKYILRMYKAISENIFQNKK